MTDFAQLVFARLADFYLLSTALLLAYGGALLAVRNRPELRIALAWGATAALCLLACALLLPAGARATPGQWLGRLQALTASFTPHPVSGASAAPQAADASVSLQPAAPLTAASPVAAPAPRSFAPAWRALTSVLACGWIGLSGAAALWLISGGWRAWRLVGRAQAAPDWAWAELQRCGGAQAARLLATAETPTAVALGAFWPAILLPQAELAGGAEPAVRAAIRHEWAHVAHGDLWLLALQRLLGVVLVAHPLYWLLRRQTRAAQELLADAAAAGGDPLAYAEQLLAWAGRAAALGKSGPSWQWAPVEALGLTMWRDSGSLERRVESLLAGQAAPQAAIRPVLRYCSAGLPAALGLCLCGVSLVGEEPLVRRQAEVTVLIEGEQRTIAGEDRLGRRFVTIQMRPGALSIRVKEYALGPDPERELTVRDSGELAERNLELYRLYQRFLEAAERQVRATGATPGGSGSTEAPQASAGKVLYRQPQPHPAPVATAANTGALAPGAVLIEAQILQVDHQRLDAAEEDLGEIIQDTLAGKCTLQDEHIIAACSPQQAAALRQRLEKLSAVRILAAPKLWTRWGQLAQIQVGREQPRANPKLTTSGEYAEHARDLADLQLSVTPRSVGAGGELVLDVLLESSVEQAAPQNASPPAIARRKLVVNAALGEDQTYLVAQRRPRDKGQDRPLRTDLLLLRAASTPATSNQAAPPAKDQVTRSYPLRSIQAARAAARLSEAIAGAQVAIEIDERSNALIVTADELTQRKAADALATLDQQTGKSPPELSRTMVLATELQQLDQLEAEAALEAAKHRLAAIVAQHTAGLTSSRERTAAELALRQAEAELLRQRNPGQPEAVAKAAVLAAEAVRAAARKNLDAADLARTVTPAERIDLELAVRRAEIGLRRALVQLEAAQAAAGAARRDAR